MDTLQVENKTKLVSCLESKEDIPHQVCEAIIRLTIDDLMSSTISDEVSVVQNLVHVLPVLIIGVKHKN